MRMLWTLTMEDDEKVLAMGTNLTGDFTLTCGAEVLREGTVWRETRYLVMSDDRLVSLAVPPWPTQTVVHTKWGNYKSISDSVWDGQKFCLRKGWPQDA